MRQSSVDASVRNGSVSGAASTASSAAAAAAASSVDSHQYSVQALVLLTDVTATLLDVVYRLVLSHCFQFKLCSLIAECGN